MKKQVLILFLFITASLSAQVITTNRNAVGMEHNLLFNAQNRYTVTQTGACQLDLNYLFDGKFDPFYPTIAPTEGTPCVIEISGLPKRHIQGGAWVGWSTRYWPATRFKIEGYDEYYVHGWVTLANYQNTDYVGNDFVIKCIPGAYTKLRFTFYKATGTDGRLGVSELFFLHPEATQPYAGLFAANSWEKNGSTVYYKSGNVGIGTNVPDALLTVGGKIKSQEVEVKIDAGADFVFSDNYPIKNIEDVETFVKENKHLPEIPSAKEMEENGIELGEMNIKLLQKIEELTLYLIEQNKKTKAQGEKIKGLEEQNGNLTELLKTQQKAIDDLKKEINELKK